MAELVHPSGGCGTTSGLASAPVSGCGTTSDSETEYHCCEVDWRSRYNSISSVNKPMALSLDTVWNNTVYKLVTNGLKWLRLWLY